ncbi:hypothetical protein FT663_02548 [Candidozyma haemuli var. vulneris]|uniref:ASTRA-associated protein 1 n=1 Tax=Candidozyma haemuli TaxID=45357 RepID=A0A2V1AYJ0_9ASCO|nr:hypothetical protein CXQ85_004991 [[Candida] haemuloni]KAF3984908.1 hypothetical protein FT662_05474 [[Candida] haemuloni var. vulneris]KAF3991797.1 hypothetical protein FT663_02548 [[Candida] haemuloni var. vulneris]PVH22423.1 hypothetical protein CXQ85_004991 [[Candida] haemuloni]
MISKHFSLRGHKAAIAGFCKASNGLVSADRDGWVVVWNLETKRPSGFWKAHDGQIITVINTELGLLTQGRDSAIRIWNMEGLAVETDLALLGREGLPKPKFDEVPVNSLNFCNVDYTGGLLATVATTDSEKFDIYELSAPGKPFSLNRVVQGFSVGNGSVDETKRDGEGIIMKLRFVGSSLLFVGYESGTVKGFKIHDQSSIRSSASESLVLNKDLKLTEVFSYSGHAPQPVLSLEFDTEEQKLYTGSASKKLIVVSVEGLLSDGTSKGKTPPLTKSAPVKQGGLGSLLGRPKIELLEDDSEPVECHISTYNLRHSGISSIQINDYIHIVFWDGVLKTYTKDIVEVGRSERGVERIKVESDQSEVAKPTTKALCGYLYEFDKSPQQHTSRKELLRLRRLKYSSLLFIGYGDNLISAYSIDDKS